MSQAAKGGPWQDDLMQEAKPGQAWRIEKQVGPIKARCRSFPIRKAAGPMNSFFSIFYRSICIAWMVRAA